MLLLNKIRDKKYSIGSVLHDRDPEERVQARCNLADRCSQDGQLHRADVELHAAEIGTDAELGAVGEVLWGERTCGPHLYAQAVGGTVRRGLNLERRVGSRGEL